MTTPTGSDPRSGPTEFRYRDHAARDTASLRLFAAVMLLLGSFLTGAWAIVALVHASWLDVNELPAEDGTLWGVLLLCLATVQGISGLLVLFDRRLGVLLGVAVSVFNLAGHVGVIKAYPIWSIAAIAINLVIIYALVAHGRRD